MQMSDKIGALMHKDYGDFKKAGYGVEVEAEFDQDPFTFNYDILSNRDLREFWTISGDGSLRGVSAEYISRFPPRRVSELKAGLEKLYDFFGPLKFNPSPRCGVHVHVNMLPYTVRTLFNFVLLYHTVEGILTNWVEPHRRGNLFALTASDADGVVANLERALEMNSFESMGEHFADMKYSALNLCNIGTLGTVEFRMLETPLSYHKIVKWLNIIRTLKLYAMRVDSLAGEAASISEKGGEEYVRRIFKNYADELITPGCGDTMLENVRNIQHLIYHPKMRGKW